MANGQINLADATALQAKLDEIDDKVNTTDARLSDARTPTAHNHTKSEITDFSDTDYATAAQGAKADTAVQPAALDGKVNKYTGTPVTDEVDVTMFRARVTGGDLFLTLDGSAP